MADLRNVYPPEIWARESLMVLQNSHVMAMLVHRDFSDEVAQYGDTINTRKPDKFTVSSLTNSIGSSLTVGAATATNVQVVLNQHQYVAFAITGRDQDTSIKNLVEEFMEPAAIPLAQKIDDDLMNSTNGLGSATNQVNVAGASLALVDFANTRKQLRSQQVPFAQMGGQSRVNMVLGTEHEAEALVVSELATADKSGLNPPPTRTGYISTIYGMNVYADQGVPVIGSSTSASTLAFHRNAMNLTTRPLEQISSEFGIRSSVMEKDGISLRVMQSFQHSSARWLISLDILYGFKLLDDNLACVLID